MDAGESTSLSTIDTAAKGVIFGCINEQSGMFDTQVRMHMKPFTVNQLRPTLISHRIWTVQRQDSVLLSAEFLFRR